MRASVSASGMIEILADLILSDILRLGIYRIKQSTKLHHRDFTRNFMRVWLKYTGNGSGFGVRADSDFFPEKQERRDFAP